MIYTKVETSGNNILVSGIKEGKPFFKKVEYSPSYFIEGDGEYKSHDGKSLIKKQCSIFDFYNLEKENKVYGLIRPQYQFIRQYFRNCCNEDINSIELWFLDIETDVVNGFPSPEKANEEILLISLKKLNSKNIHVFLTKETDDINDFGVNVVFHYSIDEEEMLKDFLNFVRKNKILVITGWNVYWFDWLYICNRIKNKLGIKFLNKISPFNEVREVNKPYKEYFKKNYNAAGIQIIDYLEIFKKFTYKEYPSYNLNYIASEELNLEKLTIPNISFREFINRWNEFVRYNVFDVLLVEKIHNKTKLFNLVSLISYFAGVNFDDAFFQVRVWDAIIYNELLDDNIAIPPKIERVNNETYPGGTVKESLVGLHDWIIVYDVTSLYPSLMRTLNISFDTILEECLPSFDYNEVKNKSYHNDYCVAANGVLYRKDKIGIFNRLMEKYFNKRKEYKELHKKNIGTELEEVYNTFQLAIKYLINSLYGATGNSFFRYYDIRIASSVTLSGQVLIKYIMSYVNEKLNNFFDTCDKDYIVANDTDSIFFSLENFNFTKEDKLSELREFSEKYISKWIDEAIDIFCKFTNAYQNCLKMEMEPIAIKGLFQAKKKYILRLENGKYKVRGLDSVRSSTPKFYRDKLSEFYYLLLEDDLTYDKIIDYIENTRKINKTIDIEQIAFPRTANNIEKYYVKEKNYAKGCPFHIKGVINYNNIIKNKNNDVYDTIKEGDKIKFVYLKPNSLGYSCLAYKGNLSSDLIDFDIIDRETIFEKGFLSPVEKILEVLDINVKQKKLF